MIELEDSCFVIEVAPECAAQNSVNSNRKHFFLEVFNMIRPSFVHCRDPTIATALSDLIKRIILLSVKFMQYSETCLC